MSSWTFGYILVMNIFSPMKLWLYLSLILDFTNIQFLNVNITAIYSFFGAKCEKYWIFHNILEWPWTTSLEKGQGLGEFWAPFYWIDYGPILPKNIGFRFSNPLALLHGRCQTAILDIFLKMMILVQCHLENLDIYWYWIFCHIWGYDYTFP